VTVRADVSALGLRVDLVAAEAHGPGVKSLSSDSSIDQRALETVQWLDAHRRPLVQDNFSQAPFPPAALREVYGVSAQILVALPASPEEREEGAEDLDASSAKIPGWVSVHSITEREWAPEHIARALDAAARAAATLGLTGQRPRPKSRPPWGQVQSCCVALPGSGSPT
jgi:maleate isomerase